MATEQRINAAPRRVRRERSETITLIFAATRQLMLDEGYAAASTRRVAKALGQTPALVHYYFPSTDDLLVALYRHASDEFHLRIIDAMNAQKPVRALWALFTDADGTALALEFIAMANHRKAIRAELVRLAEHSRRLQAKLLGPALRRAGIDPAVFSDFGVAALVQGIARSLVMEQGVGIRLGVGEAKDMTLRLLEMIEDADGRLVLPGSGQHRL